MDVSVIIVNYNTFEMTKACIDSVFDKTTKVEFEVILVDNGSKDGSKFFFEKDKRITYIYNNTNYGFGKANNIGANVAKGKYLFFLNSDTYFLNDALAYYYDYCERNDKDKLGFVGTILIDKEGLPNGYGDRFPSLIRSVKNALHLKEPSKSYLISPFKPFAVDYVLGADLFVKKGVFDFLNGFDEVFFMYYEESDLQKRAKGIGFENVIIDGPKIVHLEGRGLKGISHNKRMMVEASHQIFMQKHNSYIKYKIFLIIYIVLRLPVLLNHHFAFHENCEYMRLLLCSFFNPDNN